MGGYNALIEGLLEGIETMLNVDYIKDKVEFDALADKVVFTGAIDEYYDFKFGALEYRTVEFENQILDISNYQGNAVVNYTEADIPYTRIIEHKHFEMFGVDVDNCPKTVISKEYSSEWKLGSEPYYPINDEKNNLLYLKYKELADKEHNMIFGGRLAEYKYYDMHHIVEKALEQVKESLA